MFTVDITLDGKVETLKTTLRAARAVNGSCGNFIDTLGELSKFNLAVYVAVVAAGLDKKPADIEESVYAAGLVNLTSPLSKFVNSLAHGGVDPEAKTEASVSSGE